MRKITHSHSQLLRKVPSIKARIMNINFIDSTVLGQNNSFIQSSQGDNHSSQMQSARKLQLIKTQESPKVPYLQMANMFKNMSLGLLSPNQKQFQTCMTDEFRQFKSLTPFDVLKSLDDCYAQKGRVEALESRVCNYEQFISRQAVQLSEYKKGGQ